MAGRGKRLEIGFEWDLDKVWSVTRGMLEKYQEMTGQQVNMQTDDTIAAFLKGENANVRNATQQNYENLGRQVAQSLLLGLASGEIDPDPILALMISAGSQGVDQMKAAGIETEGGLIDDLAPPAKEFLEGMISGAGGLFGGLGGILGGGR